MSGGYFDNKEFWIQQIKESIDNLIKNNGSKTLDQFGEYKYPKFNNKILDKFKETSIQLENLYQKVHLIDYLVESDIGEETFLRDWPNNKIKNRRN